MTEESTAVWRIVGASMLIQFGFVCICKARQGCPEEILWLSHVSLLIAAIGLIANSPRAVAVSLITVLIPHAVWNIDLATCLLSGHHPLHITEYVIDTDGLALLATSHHFYLAPILWLRVRTQPEASGTCLLMAVTGFLYLSICSHGQFGAEANINYSHGLFAIEGSRFLNSLNSLTSPTYLIVLNIVMSCLAFTPAWLLLRLNARRCLQQRGRWRLPDIDHRCETRAQSRTQRCTALS